MFLFLSFIKRILYCVLFLLWLQNTSLAGEKTVLLFIVDGLQRDAIQVAMAHGAKNFKFLVENGVWVEEAYCTSPAPRMILPDGSLPWGTSSSPNVSMHTGTHVFESRKMDDIFLSARRANIKSVFAGGAENYAEFNTADYCYTGNLSDSAVVQYGIDHFKNDKARLIRLHLQRIRDSWSGPKDKLDRNSRYQQAILNVDALLGKLIQTFKQEGVWDSTYIIASADHGMGTSQESNHPASLPSSWSIFMTFYGPNIKKGEHIPYAETPDLAIMANHFLNLNPLKGDTDHEVSIEPKGPTGTFLKNIFIGNDSQLEHPKFIRRYLLNNNWQPSDNYSDYRKAMLVFIKEVSTKRQMN